MTSQSEELESSVDEGGEVACLLLPTLALPVLVPNVVVAEVLLSVAIQKEDQFPWLLGWTQWRGVEVPVLSYESLQDEERSVADNAFAKVAVFHSMNPEGAFLFYGVRLAGNPKLMAVAAHHVGEEGELGDSMLGTAAEVDGLEVVIPDLTSLEKKLKEVVKPLPMDPVL